MPQLKNTQADSLKQLLENLVIYENSGFGRVYNVILMTNKFFKESVFVRFEQSSSMSTSEEYDFKIVEIKSDGSFENIADNFKNVYERYAFLGECIPFDKSEISVQENL
jgi:DNA polymerase/3'-5' exonuclease PolX